MDLVVVCYRITKRFPGSEIYGLSSQLQRAAVSVPANIAEGRQRHYNKEFLHYLSIASGSLAEVETHIQIAGRLSYIDNDKMERVLDQAEEIGKMISGLRTSLKRKSKP